MIKNIFDNIIETVDETPLYLPSNEIVKKKKWLVCAISDECGCLNIFDKVDIYEKSLKYYQLESENYEAILLGVERSVFSYKTFRSYNMEMIIEFIDSVTDHDIYYESYALTNEKVDFLILHTHAENFTFICGNEDFLNFMFESENIRNFMSDYHKCMEKFATFCQSFPWNKFNRKDTYY